MKLSGWSRGVGSESCRMLGDCALIAVASNQMSGRRALERWKHARITLIFIPLTVVFLRHYPSPLPLARSSSFQRSSHDITNHPNDATRLGWFHTLSHVLILSRAVCKCI
jgi:hypothetical protein